MESYPKNISVTAVKRLPRYYRYFQELQSKGYEKISSKKLAELMGYTPSQVRQDLNAFGANGQQGYGYKVAELTQVLKDILGLKKLHHCILIGAGNMGQALIRHERIKKHGIIIDAIFDINPEKVKVTGDSKLYHIDQLEEYLSENETEIAILTVPLEAGQEVAERAVKGGVKAILNFVPIDLDLPEDILVNNVNITEGFLTLTYLLRERELESPA